MSQMASLNCSGLCIVHIDLCSDHSLLPCAGLPGGIFLDHLPFDDLSHLKSSDLESHRFHRDRDRAANPYFAGHEFPGTIHHFLGSHTASDLHCAERNRGSAESIESKNYCCAIQSVREREWFIDGILCKQCICAYIRACCSCPKCRECTECHAFVHLKLAPLNISSPQTREFAGLR